MNPRRLLLTAAALVLSAAPAWAQGGVNLGWNDCPSGASYLLTKTFACNTNVGIHTLVASYVAPSNVLAVSANEIVVDGMAGGTPTWPLWWSLRASAPQGCRPTSLLQSPDFTLGPFTCYDYWQGGASGGVSMDPPVGNRARIKALVALPAGSPLITSIPEGTEVYALKININSQKTTGLGACAGCDVEMCFVLNSIRINQPVGPPADGISIVLPNPAVSSMAFWQNSTVFNPCGTPTRNATWGSIKAQYR